MSGYIAVDNEEGRQIGRVGYEKAVAFEWSRTSALPTTGPSNFGKSLCFIDQDIWCAD